MFIGRGRSLSTNERRASEQDGDGASGKPDGRFAPDDHGVGDPAILDIRGTTPPPLVLLSINSFSRRRQRGGVITPYSWALAEMGAIASPSQS
jgi:hypothetical protein